MQNLGIHGLPEGTTALLGRTLQKMKDFLLFFEEKEGTSAMMRWADRFENVQVVHHQNGRGWEPLEPYHLGYDVKQGEVEELLNLIYSQPRDLQTLRDAYRLKVPDRKLVPLDSEVSVGLKMRWKPPRVLHVGNDVVDLPVNRLFKRQRYRAYREYMVEMLHENGVVPMLAVRQNIFKWALSKYHGDGTGKKGHLQFQLASGAIAKEDIPKIHVNLKRFGRLIDQCRRKHDRKREFVEWMQSRGMEVKPMLYESFLDEPQDFWSGFLGELGHDASKEEIRNVLSQDMGLKKVHSGHISEYVENHQELEDTYGSSFESWTA
jgi:hypothetical protein